MLIMLMLLISLTPADHAEYADNLVVSFKMLFNSQGVFVVSSAVAATASFASLFSKEAIAKMD